MDCRITDSRVVVRDGSIVSVPPDHFSIARRQDGYYGLVKKINQNDERAWVLWAEDNTISIKDVVLLRLETSIPHDKSPKSTPLREVFKVINPSAKEKQVAEQKINKKKFNLCIKPSTENSLEPIVDFDFCEADESIPNAAHEPGKRALIIFFWDSSPQLFNSPVETLSIQVMLTFYSWIKSLWGQITWLKMFLSFL